MPTSACRSLRALSCRHLRPTFLPKIPQHRSCPRKRKSSAVQLSRTRADMNRFNRNRALDDYAFHVQKATRQGSCALPLPRHRRAWRLRLQLARGTRAGLLRARQELSRAEGLRESPHRAAQRAPAQGRSAAGLAGAGADRRAGAEHRRLASDLRRIVEIDATDLDATTKLARLYLLGNALDQG